MGFYGGEGGFRLVLRMTLVSGGSVQGALVCYPLTQVHAPHHDALRHLWGLAGPESAGTPRAWPWRLSKDSNVFKHCL